ncbi:MoaD/ThiS family protein [Polyangium sp. 6x1]|uniref:MoaD/ThiS family protein n=1 Tax=Polyangium sp. 6x1 TaxID=3042689 RepID=UPI00248222D2|nr:MoaD/ThiS family protein [Polyangium sp. 6x1]MDI1451294.1 MoaD/ThiS family protein [Polyangium sp. 6x1]
MPSVHLTRHLYTFFPHLEGQSILVEASTAGEVVAALERLAPGIGFYICDERGRLRTHVNIFVGKQMIRDRKGLTDAVAADDEVHILQALSGG